MRRIIDQVGPFVAPTQSRRETAFAYLVHAIVGQQVSWAAAATFYRRLLMLTPRRQLTVAAVIRMRPRDMRKVGLTREKVSSIRTFALRLSTGAISLRRLGALDDDDVIQALTQLPGIGRWSAETYLVRYLGRPDVLPADDVGLRREYRIAYGLRNVPTPKAFRVVSAPWSPYRSIATWYLWRLAEARARTSAGSHATT
jgi:3-methyladenine DNA glycosylase/8-oxoguanine DNA glycosylase